MASLKDIFGWFSKSNYPTEKQFQETWKSFWHKSERLPQTQVLGLNDALDEKATKRELENIENNRKGYFVDDTELKAAYPNPKVGWYAYVGSTGTIWKASGNTWVDSGESIPSDVDLSAYAKSEDVEFETQKKANDLFRLDNIDLFPNANLIVRRYLTDGTVKDYPAGYSQEATNEGLKVSIPSAGSVATRHFLRTKKTIADGNILEANFNIIDTNGVSGVPGIGYINDIGNYVFFGVSQSGQFRTGINQSVSFSTGVGWTFLDGDKIKFIVDKEKLTIYKNEGNPFIYFLSENDFKGELLIAQAGFPIYIVSLNQKSDPIRSYVEKYVSENASGSSSPLPSCFYSFTKSSGNNIGEFKVYVKVNSNKYIGFDVGHNYDMRELVYMDYWKINRAYLYEYNEGQMINTNTLAISSGESECVWKRSANKDDFTGGTHGDELVTEVLFFANGVQIDNSLLNEDIELTACDSFYYLEKSTMHATAESGEVIEGHPIECYHVKKTDFNNKGYSTFNELKWVASGLITLWYHGICCLAKDFGKTLYSEDYEQINTGELPDKTGFREMWYRNDDNKTSAYITSKLLRVDSQGEDKTIEKDKGAVLFVQDRTIDNKYYRKMRSTSVSEGDIWQSTMTVIFDCM